MTTRPRSIDPLTRVSAWLADIDDWDASDSDVFLAAVDRTPTLPPASPAQQQKLA